MERAVRFSHLLPDRPNESRPYLVLRGERPILDDRSWGFRDSSSAVIGKGEAAEGARATSKPSQTGTASPGINESPDAGRQRRLSGLNATEGKLLFLDTDGGLGLRNLGPRRRRRTSDSTRGKAGHDSTLARLQQSVAGPQ